MFTAVDPPRSLAWKTVGLWGKVDSTVWRIDLEPNGTGTRIVQTYDVVRCPPWWEWLVARVVPPHRDRSEALAADLARIGEVAASAAL